MRLSGSLLIIDHDPETLSLLGRTLRGDYEVVDASTAAEGRQHLDERTFDIVIVGHKLLDGDGLDVMRHIAENIASCERPHVLVITCQPTVDSAVAAMKPGTVDYLQKPFAAEHLLTRIRRVLELRQLRRQRHYLVSERNDEFNQYAIVGTSRAMQQVLERVELVAQSKSTVLIVGETGTGKEMVARAVHHRSAQQDMPLIKVNCAAVPEGRLESELFGHGRHASTGAGPCGRGKFMLADGGSIFLDEIGAMPAPIQAKLLRVLQEREFEPLGAERPVRVDVRVIAASNRDLKKMVLKGTFHDDLYYRLNVVPIEVPPLRQRREDIPALTRHFVDKHSRRLGKPIDGVDGQVIATLQQYDWPGNVRELENTIERAVVVTTAPELTLRSIATGAALSTATPALPSSNLHRNIEWVQRETLRQALEQSSGVKKDAATAMGISQRAISYYVSRFMR